MSGTVNIARSLFLDEAFKDQPYTEREAFMWLVMEASWKDRTKRIGSAVVDLKRGQLAASIRFMADAWGWEKSTVDRFLKRLEKRDMIGTDSGTGVSVVTIRKYNDYQGGATDSGTAEKQNRDSSGTAAGQTRTPEEIPEEKEERGKPLSRRAAQNDDCFDHFNAVAARVGWPQVQRMTEARRASLSQRIRDAGGADGWREAIDRAAMSPLLTGQTSRGWRADFDWLCKAANFTKLMEGNYDPRPEINQPIRISAGRGSGMVEAFAAVAAARSGRAQ